MKHLFSIMVMFLVLLASTFSNGSPPIPSEDGVQSVDIFDSYQIAVQANFYKVEVSMFEFSDFVTYQNQLIEVFYSFREKELLGFKTEYAYNNVLNNNRMKTIKIDRQTYYPVFKVGWKS